MTYTEQHEPWIPNCCLALDGLDKSDNGHLQEHLAPLGLKNYWWCYSTELTIRRIAVVDCAIIDAIGKS